jgi:hypothetical protein
MRLNGYAPNSNTPPLATQFVAAPFSLADLHNVHLAVRGYAPNIANLRRTVLATPDFVRPTAQAADAARTEPPSRAVHKGQCTGHRAAADTER